MKLREDDTLVSIYQKINFILTVKISPFLSNTIQVQNVIKYYIKFYIYA